MYNYKVLSVRLSEGEAKSMERIAKAKNMTASELVRLLIAVANLWADGNREGK